MHILFLTHYFPPEVNAPASRTYENAKRWVRAGHEVTVITCAPNHPNGIIYPGYRNRLWQWEERDGIKVLRVKTYLSANKGFAKRILNYLSYMVSAVVFCPLTKRADVVVSTSPQFFCGLAGFFVSRLKQSPWVVEIRDLWPESIIAVGAVTNRRVIGLLEGVETWMYRRADRIVALTRAFKRHITGRGVLPDKIAVITNGADLEQFCPLPKENAFRAEQNLSGKFVVSYIGTHGMAHGLGTVFEAAAMLQDRKDIVFLLVGDGAERERLLAQKTAMGLTNVIMLSQQKKEKMPEILAASDACMVLLRKTDLFKTVIPSKIFEAMAMARPIILGVEGESREIIEEGDCGICIEPENSRELADGVLALYSDGVMAKELGERGKVFVERAYDRERLAVFYLDFLFLTQG
ncbi:MAG: glycosyltransferase family 4 protein [Pseudomonadota bacterium]